jgi:hypothetical protein
MNGRDYRILSRDLHSSWKWRTMSCDAAANIFPSNFGTLRYSADKHTYAHLRAHVYSYMKYLHAWYYKVKLSP